MYILHYSSLIDSVIFAKTVLPELLLTRVGVRFYPGMAPATGAEQAVVGRTVWNLSVRSLASAWFWENTPELLSLDEGGCKCRRPWEGEGADRASGSKTSRLRSNE